MFTSHWFQYICFSMLRGLSFSDINQILASINMPSTFWKQDSLVFLTLLFCCLDRLSSLICHIVHPHWCYSTAELCIIFVINFFSASIFYFIIYFSSFSSYLLPGAVRWRQICPVRDYSNFDYISLLLLSAPSNSVNFLQRESEWKSLEDNLDAMYHGLI